MEGAFNMHEKGKIEHYENTPLGDIIQILKCVLNQKR
jgi:hypothetical protein